MLAVARGLVQKPRVLLIDEMSMGLAPVIVEELLPVVRRIADETRAVVVLVEQHVQLALEVADEAMVIVHGDVQLRGRPPNWPPLPGWRRPTSARPETASHASATNALG